SLRAPPRRPALRGQAAMRRWRQSAPREDMCQIGRRVALKTTGSTCREAFGCPRYDCRVRRSDQSVESAGSGRCGGRMMLPKLGVQRPRLEGGSPGEIRAAIEWIEELGYESLWLGEAWGQEAFSQFGWIAAFTRRIKIGCGIVNVFSRT